MNPPATPRKTTGLLLDVIVPGVFLVAVALCATPIVQMLMQEAAQHPHFVTCAFAVN